MKDSSILAAFVLIAVVIVAMAAVLSPSGDEPVEPYEGMLVGSVVPQEDFPDSESRLWVYGNVNEDDRIDASDIDYLESILAGRAKATTLADVNADGRVDASDAVLLRTILTADDDTRTNVYYIDNYFTVQKVSWPVRTIATGYCSGLYTAEVTGLVDKISAVDNTIQTYWAKLNSHVQGVPSYGTTESPDWEALLAYGVDVYVPGYCDASSDKLARTQLQGIDVMFMNTSDNSGVDYPNEHIDRSIVMFGYLLQGDMERTYEYLQWHDEVLSKLRVAGDGIAQEDKAHFLMSRAYPKDGTHTWSITGKDNTNLIHAEWVGVYSIGQHDDPLLPRNYNDLGSEQILALVQRSVNLSTNTVYWMDNEHDGIRGQYDLDVSVRAWADLLSKSGVNVHYLGMAREGGNSPMYVIELAFYQDVMYPDLDNGVNYRALMDEFINRFTSEPDRYHQYIVMDNFFKDFGVLS